MVTQTYRIKRYLHLHLDGAESTGGASDAEGEVPGDECISGASSEEGGGDTKAAECLIVGPGGGGGQHRMSTSTYDYTSVYV